MKGFGMSLQGMRMGPLDPTTKRPEIITQKGKIPYQPTDGTRAATTFLSKSRSGFSGGFRIPEEQRHARLARKIQRKEERTDEHEEAEKHEISRDEIMAALQLDSSQVAGKAQGGSRAAIINDLLENMDKELEKLKRNEENIKVRKIRALTGEYHEVTEEERKKERDDAVEAYVEGQGCVVLGKGAATEKRIQAIRHKTGQLDSVKATSWEDLEALRIEQAAKLKKLEMEYLGRTQNRAIAKAIHARYKDFNEDEEHEEDVDKPTTTAAASGDKGERKARRSGSAKRPKGILKEKPLFGKDREGRGDGNRSAKRRRSKSRSQKRGREESEEETQPADPRQSIYEAKFEKFLSNKAQKTAATKRKDVATPQPFDLYTSGPGSPSKNRKRFRGFHDPTQPDAYEAADFDDEGFDQRQLEEV
jgi:hypothetical protein